MPRRYHDDSRIYSDAEQAVADARAEASRFVDELDVLKTKRYPKPKPSRYLDAATLTDVLKEAYGFRADRPSDAIFISERKLYEQRREAYLGRPRARDSFELAKAYGIKWSIPVHSLSYRNNPFMALMPRRAGFGAP